MIEFLQTKHFCSLGFKSANDEPHRDPTEVEVYVYTARHKWVESEKFKLDFE
jgi:hypothetical protein